MCNEYKICSKCKITKSIDSFRTGLKRGKPYIRANCKDCDKIYHQNKYNTEYGHRYQKKQYEKLKEYMLWRDAKRRAKQKNIEFNISVSDVIIPIVCPVLGIPIYRRCNGISENSASLDRVDISKGYIKGNICVISNRANAIKNTGTVDEHLKVIKYLRKIQNKLSISVIEYHTLNIQKVKSILKRVRDRAKRNCMKFELDKQDIKIPKICPVLTIPIFIDNKIPNDFSPSVDRMDNTKGYTKDNICIISNKANVLKSDGTIEEHKKIIEYMKGYIKPSSLPC